MLSFGWQISSKILMLLEKHDTSDEVTRVSKEMLESCGSKSSSSTRGMAAISKSVFEFIDTLKARSASEEDEAYISDLTTGVNDVIEKFLHHQLEDGTLEGSEIDRDELRVRLETLTIDLMIQSDSVRDVELRSDIESVIKNLVSAYVKLRNAPSEIGEFEDLISIADAVMRIIVSNPVYEGSDIKKEMRNLKTYATHKMRLIHQTNE